MTQQEIAEPDYFIPYPGGVVECSKAIQFYGDPDPQTGVKELISLPDRVTVTFGKKKAVLKGAMVKAIHDAFRSDEILQAWCEKC